MPHRSILLLSLVLALVGSGCARVDAAGADAGADAPPAADAAPNSRADAAAGADAPLAPDAAAAPGDAAEAEGCDTPGELPAAAGSLVLHHYAGEAGSRDYWLYVPSGAADGPRPLVVLFHGCTQTAEELVTATGFDRVAEAHGALVAWPEQSLAVSAAGCWSWFAPAHQQRGAGEPAIVAAIVDEIAAAHPVDPDRTYVGGFSAGASMALVMAAAYPDRFAAVAAVAACPYRGACYGLESTEVMVDGLIAAMGAYARPVPLFVAHGSADAIVAPEANRVAREQFLGAADRLDDGVANQSVPDAPAVIAPGYAGGMSYQQRLYAGAGGSTVAEHWVIDGLGHSWCGGADGQAYATADGPDLSRESYRFLCEHAMP